MTFLNLTYVEPTDTTYFVETDNIAPEYKEEADRFLLEYVVVVNDTPNYVSRSDGTGSYPAFQLLKLYNFAPIQVKTDLFDDDAYQFEIILQGQQYEFTILGSLMPTYADLIREVESRCPINITMLSSFGENGPDLILESAVAATQAVTTGSGSESTTVGQNRASTINVEIFLDEIVDKSDTESTDGKRAKIVTNLLGPVAPSDLLTLVPNDDTVVFEFSKNGTTYEIPGSAAQTYFDLQLALNGYDGISSRHRTSVIDGVYMLIITLSLPPEESAAPNVYDTLKLMPRITDFTGLNINSDVFHVLEEPVAGGDNLLDVLVSSKRPNGSSWSSIMPIKNDKDNVSEIISKDADQKQILDDINEQKLDEQSISIGSLVEKVQKSGVISKLAFALAAKGQIASVVNTFIGNKERD